MDLEPFKKLPLGGVDRRALVRLLADQGPSAARAALARQRACIHPRGARIAEDAAVVILGGSNGITRAIALQLLFGERAAVVGVHYDSAKMQIGPHHVQAMAQAAHDEGLRARFFNLDATREETIAEVLADLREGYRAVHLINGIAAGTPKRFSQHGPTMVTDLDVAFDPLLQVPDFSRPDHVRRYGLVEVGVASEAEIARTHRFMGRSTLLWAEPLAAAGLLVPDESVVAFCDYVYPDDDPVYGMGPLATAKQEQRQLLGEIKRRLGARTVRICYPAMATTALGTIPGGLLLYALTSQILRERGAYRDLGELAAETMALWTEPPPVDELRLDAAYQQALDEFRSRRLRLRPEDFPAAISSLFDPAST